MTEYWTVGEFARRAGVTVRTIQYYDQKKLLEPSAKGPQNRRLYSEKDERELQRILVLKFLGNSLADIRAALAGDFEDKDMPGLIDRQAELLGRDLGRLMRRMATLRELREQVGAGEDPDWAEIAGSIDRLGAPESDLRHTLHGDDPHDLAHLAAPAGTADGSRLTGWHEVIAEALGLMAAGVPADDAWAREVASRYRVLCEGEGPRRPGDLIPLDGDGARDGDAAALSELRRSVDDYLAAACDGEAPWVAAASS